MSEKILSKINPGVVTGDNVKALFGIAKANKFALPAVNVVSSNSINAVIEAAKVVNSAVIIQFSNGGAQPFMLEKGFQTKVKELQLPVLFPGQNMFTKCLNYMEYP
jgi:fructose-bisphosphate aldolase, class II